MDTLSGKELEIMQPIAANDALRFLPGAVIATAGQRGGFSSLFVRGGDSRYNKVIVDGVTVNEPGGTIDLGTLPLDEADRLEFSRGAQSTLYGIGCHDQRGAGVDAHRQHGDPRAAIRRRWRQLWTPHMAIYLGRGSWRYDYNLFGDQFNTAGAGPTTTIPTPCRVGTWEWLGRPGFLAPAGTPFQQRYRCAGRWNFNGQPLMQPDLDQLAG